MATKKVDVDETSMTAQQFAGHLEGLVKRVKDGSFGQRHFEALAEGRDPFCPAKTGQVNEDTNDQVDRWRQHFKILYRINPDFSELYIPERIEGFDRLIIVPKGLTHRKWVETARTIHEVSLYNNNDLDGVVTINDRTPKDRSYGVWIRDRQEADEEFKNKSAQDIVRMAPTVQGITLLERLVGGIGHLFEKMCHMDIENWTLCSGSRSSGANVLSVGWYPEDCYVRVDSRNVSDSNSFLRTRAVVS